MTGRDIDFGSLEPGDHLPRDLPTRTARATICGERPLELEALLDSRFCEGLVPAFRAPDAPIHWRVGYFADAYVVASSCRLASIDPPKPVTDILADPPADEGHGWIALTSYQVASARMGWSPEPESSDSPWTTRRWQLFELLPVWSASGLSWGGEDRLAEIFLGMGWRDDPDPMHTGSPSLAVPFVMDALAEIDADRVRAIEESSKRAQLLMADAKLTRKAAVVDVRPFVGGFRGDAGSIAGVALSVGHHVKHQYELAARSDRSGRAWRDRFAEPDRGVVVTTKGLDPGLADCGWDPLVEPLLESIRRAMAKLTRTSGPRIRWQVGREVVWDTNSRRWLPTEKAALT